MESLRQDLLHSIRILGANPGFATIAIATLAIGIGANTAIFTVVHGVLLKPLDYPQSERLISVSESCPRKGYPQFPASPANYLDWKRQNRLFSKLAAFNGNAYGWKNGNVPEHLEGALVTTEFFGALGVSPLVGRDFLAEEGQPGRTHVTILSEKLWASKFGRDRSVLGRPISLDGESYTIVGIMPMSVSEPDNAELWTPLAFSARDAAQRGGHYLGVIGRLANGVTLESARAWMISLARRLEQAYPGTNTGWSVVLVPIQEQMVGPVRPALLVLLGAVGFVLLIACANVANLLLARATARRREISIRAALGASRGRMIRQSLTESLTLAALGASVGLLIAYGMVTWFSRLKIEDVPTLSDLAVDPAVLVFTVAAAVVTGILFGLAPALQSARADLSLALRQAGRGAAGGSRAIRSGLVIAELALALVLLAGAVLMLRSFYLLNHVDPGYRTDHLLTAGISLSDARYPKREQQVLFYDRVLERLRSIPGVESAGAATVVPLTGVDLAISYDVVGRPVTPGNGESAAYNAVSPDYFRTMGIALLRGRLFTEQDNDKSESVAIVSETFARHNFPNEDPMGKSIHMGTRKNAVRRVIGVVGDIRWRSLDDTKPPAAMYEPYAQTAWSFMTFAIRSASNPGSLVSAVRASVAAVDADQPVDRIKTMVELTSSSLARQRLAVWLLGAFAAVALALSAIGVYGVMSYLAQQRVQEIGIRMALGAGVGNILGMVLRGGLTLALAGIALGLAASFASTRLLKTQLYGVTATDPWTFASVAALLALVAVLACAAPAIRAARVDPVIALRYE